MFVTLHHFHRIIQWMTKIMHNQNKLPKT
uniref:Uncharacterized protein n=1 Tax=Romanomermis culicivorax TaxID=13658 RepID=A0A915ISZ7_ROMCU